MGEVTPKYHVLGTALGWVTLTLLHPSTALLVCKRRGWDGVCTSRGLGSRCRCKDPCRTQNLSTDTLWLQYVQGGDIRRGCLEGWFLCACWLTAWKPPREVKAPRRWPAAAYQGSKTQPRCSARAHPSADSGCIGKAKKWCQALLPHRTQAQQKQCCFDIFWGRRNWNPIPLPPPWASFLFSQVNEGELIWWNPTIYTEPWSLKLLWERTKKKKKSVDQQLLHIIPTHQIRFVFQIKTVTFTNHHTV